MDKKRRGRGPESPTPDHDLGLEIETSLVADRRHQADSWDLQDELRARRLYASLGFEGDDYSIARAVAAADRAGRDPRSERVWGEAS